MPVAYDLIVMLDSTAEEDARAKVLTDVEAAIPQGGGEIANKQDWGKKIMAFEIRHKADADYHLLQFLAPPELPSTLSRSLAINDTVLRHRIIKTPGGKPAAPSSPPSPAPAAEAAPPAPEAPEPAAEPAEPAPQA